MPQFFWVLCGSRRACERTCCFYRAAFSCIALHKLKKNYILYNSSLLFSSIFTFTNTLERKCIFIVFTFTVWDWIFFQFIWISRFTSHKQAAMSKSGHKFRIFLLCCSLSVVMACDSDGSNKARYDNYRLLRLRLQTAEHIQLFQELEDESDSYTFYGHALQAPQDLTLLVAAHK